MPDIKTLNPSAVLTKYVNMGDGSYAERIVVVNPDGSNVGGGSAGTDRELVVSTYRCKAAFTGASVGDTITATQVIDVSGATPSTVSTIWRNQTSAADLASAPSAANLELTGSTALTEAQLRASAIDIEPAYSASGKAALSGAFNLAGQSADFTPIAGRAFNVSIWGTFVAAVRLERSFDAGATWLPLTANGTALMSFSGPVSEQWSDDEVGVRYRLKCTAYTSGTVNYRISQ